MDLGLYVTAMSWLFVAFTVLCSGLGIVLGLFLFLKLACRVVSCFLDLMVVDEAIRSMRKQGLPMPWLERARRWHRGSHG